MHSSLFDGRLPAIGTTDKKEDDCHPKQGASDGTLTRNQLAYRNTNNLSPASSVASPIYRSVDSILSGFTLSAVTKSLDDLGYSFTVHRLHNTYVNIV